MYRNRPSDLDLAVLDRVDETVEVPLPDASDRARLLEFYFRDCFCKAPAFRLDKLCARFGLEPVWGAPRVHVAIDSRLALDRLVSPTAGFSGREISKLLLSVQGAVYAQERLAHAHKRGPLHLTQDLWDRTINWKLQEAKPRSKPR